jgi:hypothetical protein
MERKQKGEQFRIIDAARLPEKPIEPDPKKLFLVATALGLGLGAGLILLLDFLNPSFKMVKEVQQTGFPILAVLSAVDDEKIIRGQRINAIGTAVCLAVAFLLLIGFAVVTFKGPDQTKAFISAFIR